MSEKNIVNTLYHAGIVTFLTIGNAMAMKKIVKSNTPKIDFSIHDVGMLALDVGVAMFSKDYLIKEGIIPSDIMK